MSSSVSISGSINSNSGGSFTISWSSLDNIVYMSTYAGNVKLLGPYTIIIRTARGSQSRQLVYANGTPVDDISTTSASGSMSCTLTAEDIAKNDQMWGTGDWKITVETYYISSSIQVQYGSYYTQSHTSYNDWDSNTGAVLISRYSNPTAPTWVSLSSTVSDGQVTLSWGGAQAGTNNPIADYIVYWRDSSDGKTWGEWIGTSMEGQGQKGATSWKVFPPDTRGWYRQFKVCAVGTISGYNSAETICQSLLQKIVYGACTAPTSITVSETNVYPKKSVTLSWSGAGKGTNNAIKGYQVYRSTSETGTYTKISDVTSTDTKGSVSVTAPENRNASYYYKVITVGSISGYNSGQSSVVATLTCSWGDVAAPTGVKVSSAYVLSGNVTLSWNAASNATNNAVKGYNVYRNGSFYKTTTSTSMSVPCNSTVGSSYTYTVYTLGTYSNSGASSGVAVYTAGNPTPPSTLTVSNATPDAGTKVTLSWRGAAAGSYNAISGYQIFRSTSASGTYSHLATVQTTATSGSYEVTAPSSMGSSYYFKVKTVGALSASTESAYVSVTAKTYTKCSAPGTFALETVVSLGDNTNLTWALPSDGTNNTVVGYEIQRRESSDGATYGDWLSLSVITNVGTTTLSVSPPDTADHSYQYRIQVRGSAGSSFYSDWKISSNTLRRDYTKCSPPSTFALSQTISRDSVELTWSGAASGFGNSIVGYEIQQCESSNGSVWGDWAACATTTAQKITVSPPNTAGYTYKYRIRVQGSAGLSYYSDWLESSNTLMKAYTCCVQPSFCSLSSNSSKIDVTLTWGESGDGDGNAFIGYEVQRSGSADRVTWNTWETLTSNITETSMPVSPPGTAGYAYKFRVRGCGSAGEPYHSLFTESDGTLTLGTVDIGSFTDTVITPGVTHVKAVHITEMQNAINMLASVYGHAAFDFTSVVPNSDAGCSFLKDWTAHITELRQAIDQLISNHDEWIDIPRNCPTADIIYQIRSILKSMQ